MKHVKPIGFTVEKPILDGGNILFDHQTCDTITSWYIMIPYGYMSDNCLNITGYTMCLNHVLKPSETPTCHGSWIDTRRLQQAQPMRRVVQGNGPAAQMLHQRLVHVLLTRLNWLSTFGVKKTGWSDTIWLHEWYIMIPYGNIWKQLFFFCGFQYASKINITMFHDVPKHGSRLIGDTFKAWGSVWPTSSLWFKQQN